MPSKVQSPTDQVTQQLAAIGLQIRAQRKALKVSATTTAEASGMSRVTLHRIEQGEPSVTVGAYANALAALGMGMRVGTVAEMATKEATHPPLWLPARVRLADYPQLKLLAWQVHGTETLTPVEALGIYQRNARHMDTKALEPAERELIEALQLALGDGAKGGPRDA
jgi:transcriptional regulator with XRE-family HTH domain